MFRRLSPQSRSGGHSNPSKPNPGRLARNGESGCSLTLPHAPTPAHATAGLRLRSRDADAGIVRKLISYSSLLSLSPSLSPSLSSFSTTLSPCMLGVFGAGCGVKVSSDTRAWGCGIPIGRCRCCSRGMLPRPSLQRMCCSHQRTRQRRHSCSLGTFLIRFHFLLRFHRGAFQKGPRSR